MIRQVLQQATQSLHPMTAVPRLEAEVLLSHVLKVSRAYLHTWPEQPVDTADLAIFMAHLSRRIQGEPLAYIMGEKEFWSLPLTVSPAVLIPRPETELLVEVALQRGAASSLTVAELGTGSGAVAIALATERPAWQLYASEVSQSALAIAKQNAARLHQESILFYQGDWLNAFPSSARFDMILANPPYLSYTEWLGAIRINQAIRHEPASALISGKEGLEAIQQLLSTAAHFLNPGCCFLIEHAPHQAEKVRHLFQQTGYHPPKTYCDLAGKERVTVGTMLPI